MFIGLYRFGNASFNLDERISKLNLKEQQLHGKLHFYCGVI